MALLNAIRPGRARARHVLLAATLGLALAGGAEPVVAEERQASEYDLKAVFLFHFAQFVTWPSSAFPTANTPITIGVLGADPFGGALDDVVANEVVNGRKLVVRRCQSVDETEHCHILFISSSEASRMEAILGTLRRRSVLTVGETKDFVARSGMVGLVVAHDRLRMRINLGAANAANLKISSQMLRQAEIVGSGVHEE